MVDVEEEVGGVKVLQPNRIPSLFLVSLIHRVGSPPPTSGK